MRHEYLVALHGSASAVPGTGWTPQFLAVYKPDATSIDGETLSAACPLYLKDHSYGEYVFDWAWADAYQRHGIDYYPKLLDAVPFTPVPGPRLLATDQESRSLLLRAMQQLAQQAKLSSAHLLFLDEADQRAARETGWMMRTTVQFHWINRGSIGHDADAIAEADASEPERPYLDFADFLAGLQREKRKKIQQEQRKVRDAGVDFIALQGAEITPDDWDFFYRCYTLTYRAHHSSPYLTRDFFKRVAETMTHNWLLFIGVRAGERIAASLICIDPKRRAAFGRYWGSTEHVSCMHFDACYYQPLQWCIAHGYQRFEGGAQGEHKMARGLMPVQTWSAHWLAHPQFAEAVGDFLKREGLAIEGYIDELNDRKPFKATTA
ncbi:GNAT family N-acetyltransferase [soil metagenome]